MVAYIFDKCPACPDDAPQDDHRHTYIIWRTNETVTTYTVDGKTYTDARNAIAVVMHLYDFDRKDAIRFIFNLPLKFSITNKE